MNEKEQLRAYHDVVVAEALTALRTFAESVDMFTAEYAEMERVNPEQAEKRKRQVEADLHFAKKALKRLEPTKWKEQS